MDLLKFTAFATDSEYKIHVQINTKDIISEYNSSMGHHFYNAFTRALLTTIVEFHGNLMDKKELDWNEHFLQKQFTISSKDKEIQVFYIKVFDDLKPQGKELLKKVENLYSIDGSKMTNYLVKYINHYFLDAELKQTKGITKEEPVKKLKL